jgi:hypothetical protein
MQFLVLWIFCEFGLKLLRFSTLFETGNCIDDLALETGSRELERNTCSDIKRFLDDPALEKEPNETDPKT